MVSFADMITIMMSFFVIMFALATGKNEKQKQKVQESIEYRFGPQWQPFGKTTMGLYKDGANFKSQGRDAQGRPTIRSPLDDDAEGIRFGRANLPGRGNKAGCGGSVYFDEFSADLNGQQKVNLRKIADRCVGKPQKIEVLGHASKQPLPAGSPYHDHWDLAYARCRIVAEVLKSLGIEPQRIRMSVAGDTEPVYRRDPIVYARKNSRVDVYLMDILVSDFDPPKEDTPPEDDGN